MPFIPDPVQAGSSGSSGRFIPDEPQWEPAESVAKNDAGEFQALIGGKWVPATAAAKNDAGEFRVIRARLVTDAASEQHQSVSPVNAGLANLTASTLGLPMEVVKQIANLGIAGYGSIKGLAGGVPPDLIERLPGDIPNTRALFERAARDTGVSGLSPENPFPENKAATAAYDFTSRGGFIPGGALAAAGSMVGEKIGGVPGGIIGSMLPSASIKAYNELRGPSLAEAQSRNIVRDRTLQKAQDAGYKVSPSSVTDSPIGKTFESFAGGSAIKGEFEIHNQKVTNRLVREELSVPSKGIEVPENAPLTETLLEKLRNQASKPYEEVAAISPVASRALERLKDVRAEARDQWKYYDAQAVPEAKRKAVSLDNQSLYLESFLDKQATRAGKPQLIQQLREARAYIAKTYEVDRALNLGNGNVDAKILGQALDRGRPLTGNLEIIAKFAEGPGRQVTREASKVSPPGVGGLTWPLAAALGVEGVHYLGPYGAAMAAIPFARGGARSAITSDWYQNSFGRPDYTPGLQPGNSLTSLLMETYGNTH